jgi:chromosome segregation ATPase
MRTERSLGKEAGKMRALLGIVGMSCMLAFTADAQVQRSGNADARVAQQLQQLSNEKVALQSENSKLKQELEQIKAQLQKAEASSKKLEGRNRALEASAGRGTAASQQAEEQLERNRIQLQELVTKFRETAQTLRDVEADGATAKSQLAVKEREVKTCIDRNAALYNLNTEVLDRMENRGLWSSLTEREPFTRLKRVELENLIDDYKYRADELRLEHQQAQQQAQQRAQQTQQSAEPAGQ